MGNKENQNIKYITSKEIFPLIQEQLIEGRKVSFTVSGVSMMPWIINNRDEVELIPLDNVTLQKGDIILFQSAKDKYILHRIIKVYPKAYLTAGDGNLYIDGIVPASQVLAKVITIRRRNKIIHCDEKKWKVIFRIWMTLFPFRKYLLKMFWFIGKFKTQINFHLDEKRKKI